MSDVSPGAGVWDAGRGAYAQEAVMSGWNGAIYAPYFGPRGAMIYWGGGDGDWFGNEVYIFALSNTNSASRFHEARKFSRLTDPSTAMNGTAAATDPAFDVVKGLHGDGTPAVPHTYGGLAYLPPQGGGGLFGSLLVPTRGATYRQNAYRWAVRCDLYTGVWSVASTGASAIGSGTANAWCYFPPHRKAYGFPSDTSVLSSNNYYHLDFSAGSGTGVFGSVYCGDHDRPGYAMPRYWEAQKRIVLCGHDAAGLGFWVYNMDTPGLPFIPTLTGDAMPLSAGPGFDIVPETGMFYVRSNLSGDKQFIWTIKPPEYAPMTGPWVVTKRTLTGVTVADNTPNGSWGRGMSWASKARILMWVNSTGGDTYGFRPLGT